MPGFKPSISLFNRKTVAVVLASLFLVACPFFLMLFETSFIYYPSRQILGSPSDEGLIFEDIHRTTSDGLRIHGWLMKPTSEPVAWLLFSHGNAGNISGRPRIAQPLVARRVAVLLYDYRGYGKSEGSPDEQGTYLDGQAMLEELLSRARQPRQVFLFGRSLGGGVSHELAVRHPELGGLITDATFTSIPQLARILFPIPGVWRVMRTRYDNLSKVPQIKIPRLVMHGTQDEMIPFSMAEQLRDATNPPAQFFPISGAGHNDTFLRGGSEYADAIVRFIEQCQSSP